MPRSLAEVPDDPLLWRPQEALPTRTSPIIADPVVEPLWSGTRVLLHYEAAPPQASGEEPAPPRRLIMLDRFGDEIVVTEAKLARAMASAFVAFDAVIDGILTAEATRSGEGMAVITEPKTSMVGMMMSRDPEVEIVRKDPVGDLVTAFVAIDLLRIDGQELLDVPLLERKRILESIVIESELVRISPHARPPVDTWVATWKSAGLKGAMLKAANSRYIPGGLSPEWHPVTRVASRR